MAQLDETPQIAVAKGNLLVLDLPECIKQVLYSCEHIWLMPSLQDKDLFVSFGYTQRRRVEVLSSTWGLKSWLLALAPYGIKDAQWQKACCVELCEAMSITSLTSNISAHTRVVKKLPLTNARTDTPDFHQTTSPRLESRLARRPQPQFPYTFQPFTMVSVSPEQRTQVSVEEANRRLQQAQALSIRQQEFGQLLDLASSGKTESLANMYVDLFKASLCSL